MQINNNWSIEEDSRSWNVKEVTHGINSRTKEVGTAVNTTFHGTLLQACFYVLDNLPKKYIKEHKDLKDLRNEIINCKNLIIKAVSDSSRFDRNNINKNRDMK